MIPNNNNNDNDDIRPPDPVKRERLIDPPYQEYNYNFYNKNEYDYDIDDILKMSLENFELEEEQKVLDFLSNERKKLFEKYDNIKKKIRKIQFFDTINNPLYEIIVAIIEMYEMEAINTYKLDEKSYNDIMKLIKSIRLTNEEKELLVKLIIL